MSPVTSLVEALAQIDSLLEQAAIVPEERRSWFFKTGVGEYAAHDHFMGVPVPAIRKIAKTFPELSLGQIEFLLKSKTNEKRLLALLMLGQRYLKGAPSHQEAIYQFYVHHLEHVNNWNLVDTSAPTIMGAYLLTKDRGILFALAASPILWERRIAIVATLYFIRQKDLEDTFKIARCLLKDPEDLIHKAVGWMLREAGKQDPLSLTAFLDKEATLMPRTMLRYAIERLPEKERKYYLGQK